MEIKYLECAMEEMFDFINDIPSKVIDFEFRCDYDKAFSELDLVKSDNVIKLPCKIGDTLWSEFRPAGMYFKQKDAPFPCEVVFIGINGNIKDYGGGFVNVLYRNGKYDGMMQFNFNQFGKVVFTDREKAIESMEYGESVYSYCLSNKNKE